MWFMRAKFPAIFGVDFWLGCGEFGVIVIVTDF